MREDDEREWPSAGYCDVWVGHGVSGVKRGGGGDVRE